MDCRGKYNTLEEVMELINEQGLNGMGAAIQILMNQAMLVEREQHLQASPYERTDDRHGYANGFKAKTVKSRVGELHFSIPQVRDSKFYPSCLEKGMRSERALKIAIAEMYVQGVSTRKVSAVMEQMCGLEVTSTQVSRAASLLDGELNAWRTRSLADHTYKYVFFDAIYESVRQNGCVSDAAVLVAVGVREDGKREVLGCSVKLSEAEAHWRAFFVGLVERGLHGVEMIVSDAHSGLAAARKAVFPGILWQRCQFHLQQNAQAYVPKKDMRSTVAADIRAIFNAPGLDEANRLLKLRIQDYEKSAPQLANWMEENLPEGFTAFHFPAFEQKRIRTSNVAERLNREIRRRTRVACVFSNEASALRLVSSILMETSEDWITGKVYLKHAGKEGSD